MLYHAITSTVKCGKAGNIYNLRYLPPVVQTAKELMMTPEQVLARLNQMRKDFDDDKDSEEYQTLTHALLFLSYQMALFKQYMADANKK
jgi:hypothetical protein